MRIVDFHNHYYPPEYVAALTSGSLVKVTYDADGNPCVHYPGDYNILVPGHRDIEYRQRVLDEHGVATQVLTFTTPGVHVERPDVAVRLAARSTTRSRESCASAPGASRRWRRCRSTTRPRPSPSSSGR
jgi:aminocarboxymuconate-semialdehyde decarboxylase